MQPLAHRLPRKAWRKKQSIRLWIKEHRRQLRYALVGLGVLAIMCEVAQLAYPRDKLLPFSQIQGQQLGAMHVDQASIELTKRYANAAVTIKTDTKSFPASFTDAGIAVDARASAQAAADYPFWQRLLPFSLVIAGIAKDAPLQVTYNDVKVDALAEKVAANSHSDAVNASIIFKKGRAEIVPSIPTKDYPATRVVAAIKNGSYSPRATITVSPKTTPAALTNTEVEPLLDEIQERVDAQLVLSIDGKDHQADAQTKGSWLTFTANANATKLDVGLNAQTIKDYIEEIQGESYKAPGTTTVHLIDDREVSRSIGSPGRGVHTDKAVAAIETALQNTHEDTLNLEVGNLDPLIAYDKKYSNTDKTLTPLVANIAASKGNYGIAMMEIDGPSVNANGNRQFVAASTYKLYVAYAVVKEVEAGRMSWSESIGGRTVAQCFDAMIIVSDNACPKAFGARIGWANITAAVRAEGVSAKTQLGSSMYTTANDLAYFLYRVEKGTLLSAAGRDRLISAMKRQSYTRAGIPKGAGGTVADKVGEVDGYVHDAAIVYGSHKTYVLVVMSYGGSWAGIADATQQIHAAVNK